MLVVRTFEFDTGPSSTGEALAGVLAAVDDEADGNGEIWAYLEDRGHTKTSQVARALKKHPSLDALGPPPQGTPRTRLASLPGRDDAGAWATPIDRATALAVARAVPRPLAFMYSHFVVGPLPSLWLVPGEPPRPRRLGSHLGHDDVPASIVLLSSWWTSRRQIGLRVHLGMTAPPRDAAKMPPLPDDTRRLLARFGKPHKERQELVPDADEANLRSEADPAAEALAKSIDLDAIAFPYPDVADDHQHASEAFGSFKDELPRVLPGFRYRPTGTRGLWRMAKRTAAQNELVFEVDRGPMGGHARASLVIRGALWSHYFRLPVRRGAAELKVWDPSTLAKVCANWGAAVAVLEREVLAELERLYWPGYAWYSAD
jgi:hypothetical protein